MNYCLLLLFAIFSQISAIPPSHHKNKNRLHSTSHPIHGPSSTTTEPTQSSEPIQEASTTTVKTTTTEQLDSYELKYQQLNLSKTAEREISSCFGKLKTSLSLNPSFRAQFDKVVKVARLDQIDNLIARKIADLCTHDERTEVDKFLKSFKPAAQIANEIYRTLSNDERDHLNVWSNLNDSDSEQQFYLSKFNSLPASKLEAYSTAYNSLITRFLNSTMKGYINKFISQLKENDFKQIAMFAKEDEWDSIRKYIKEKLKNSKYTSIQKSELENFFASVYSKVTSVSGTGTRQYELKHGSYEDG